MVVRISELFKLNTLSSGRRMFALRKMRLVAQQYDYTRLVVYLDRALEHEERVLALDREWRTRDSQTSSPLLRELDNLVDQTVTAVRDGAAAQAKGARPDDEINELVGRFTGKLFPAGVAAITNLPYVEQLAEVENLVRTLQGDLAPMVMELGLTRQVKRLAELVVAYREALETRPEPLRFEVVRDARARGQSNLSAAVAITLGRYHDDENPDHVRVRSALLAPIMEQDEAVRAYLRMRRAVRDIDPDTGELTNEVELDQPESVHIELAPAPV